MNISPISLMAYNSTAKNKKNTNFRSSNYDSTREADFSRMWPQSPEDKKEATLLELNYKASLLAKELVNCINQKCSLQREIIYLSKFDPEQPYLSVNSGEDYYYCGTYGTMKASCETEIEALDKKIAIYRTQLAECTESIDTIQDYN